MTDLLPTYNFESPEELYTSLVKATHDFYTLYVNRRHITRRPGTHTRTLKEYVLQAEKKAMEDGRVFQTNPTPDHLRKYQTSRDELVALQQCSQTDTWHTLINSINHLTNVGSMWHLINKIVRKKDPAALHHSPTEYAQSLIENV